MLGVQAPMIPVVGEMIRQCPGTISLAQGVVHYGPPPGVAEAAARAAAGEPGVHRYGPACGVESLIEGIRAKLVEENGVFVGDDRRVVVTAGSNMGFVNAVLAVADVDDEIILLSPFYFNHEMAVRIAGCRVALAATDDNYQPDLRKIESAITERTRAIATISPNNPTGAVYPAATLEAINTLCRDRQIYHIADEAYEYFTYDDARHFSPASLAGSEGHTIGLYSFSKTYGMAGWRVGYMVIPAHLEESVKKIQDTNLICPPIMSQLAAGAALSAGPQWCRTRVRPFARVRDLVLTELERLGDRVHVPRPGGAFYVLIRANTRRAEMELIEALIREYGVAVMPGSTFGAADGCYLRIAYGALDERSVVEGMGRLVRGLEALL